MNSQQQAEEQQQQPAQPGYSFGERLQTARRALNLSRQDVAAEMRLGVDIITALEEEDLDRLGASIYVTGYLKKYAGLLKIPLEPLMAAYKQVQLEEPEIISQAARPPAASYNKLIMRLVTWGIVIVLLAGLVSWVQMQDFSFFGNGDTASVAPDEQQPGALLAPLPPVVDDAAPDGAATTLDQAAPETAEPEPAEPEPAAAVETPVPAGAASEPVADGDELVLLLSEDSWTEVTDSNGKRLVYDLLRAGREKHLHGRAPFRVFLGNAQAVRIEYNGELYDFSQYVRGNLARFRLGNSENHDG